MKRVSRLVGTAELPPARNRERIMDSSSMLKILLGIAQLRSTYVVCAGSKRGSGLLNLLEIELLHIFFFGSANYAPYIHHRCSSGGKMSRRAFDVIVIVHGFVQAS